MSDGPATTTADESRVDGGSVVVLDAVPRVHGPTWYAALLGRGVQGVHEIVTTLEAAANKLNKYLNSRHIPAPYSLAPVLQAYAAVSQWIVHKFKETT